MNNQEEPLENKQDVPKSEIALLTEQLADQKNLYLRVLADFDNFKKRTNAEREQFFQFAHEELITDLLPILDGFGRALSAAEKQHASEEILKGLALIKKQLEDVLKKRDLEEIVTVGQPFDANFHEAIMQQEHEGPKGIVIEEVQKGYALNGKVIRPSMVIVSK
ncbi:nucleotide exchange factor GrpE [Candidatus Saganbacteria bacterium]|nr:nucleotide exchange factor GrpE [Candidatus Saganbacteria bacterium]